MKLEILEHMRAIELNRVPPRSRVMSVTMNQREETSTTIPDLMRYRFSAELGITDVCPAEQKTRAFDKAKIQLIRHLYGPITSELRELMIELQYQGFEPGHPLREKIERLITLTTEGETND